MSASDYGRRETELFEVSVAERDIEHSRVQVFTYRRLVSSLSQTASLIYNKGPSQEMCCLFVS